MNNYSHDEQALQRDAAAVLQTQSGLQSVVHERYPPLPPPHHLATPISRSFQAYPGLNDEFRGPVAASNPSTPSQDVSGYRQVVPSAFEMLPIEPSLRDSPSQQDIVHTPVQKRPLPEDFDTPTHIPNQSAHFPGLKFIPDPPHLAAWRQRLFDVAETITMTEEEFQTYFPHVDNVYSHRSTQKYKRKPFICHYWDCRLKGRPPGTPKSTDPNKKQRQRVARPRDLCDMKIKITEFSEEEQPGQQPAGKRYMIERIVGPGAKGHPELVGAPHRHTLEESDRVKRNSIQRAMMQKVKGTPRAVQSVQKSYHTQATGLALETVQRHAAEHPLKLYGSCFCPFVQRVWIALEAKGLAYQYYEIDPYKKPKELLDINPRGLIPALKHDDWGCYESNVLMEYLEDLDSSNPLLPPNDPKLRAYSRLWADHINRNIIPAFYRLLQEQDGQKQLQFAEELKEAIGKLIDAANPSGPFFLGPSLSYVDVQLTPWLLRLRRVLKPYRGWPEPEPGSRWAAWVDAIEADPHVKATTSTDGLYIDSYERYAENRPNTSQVANAVNSGRGLP